MVCEQWFSSDGFRAMVLERWFSAILLERCFSSDTRPHPPTHLYIINEQYHGFCKRTCGQETNETRDSRILFILSIHPPRRVCLSI